MARVDSPVPLMHHDPDRSWITDTDHPKGTHPLLHYCERISAFNYSSTRPISSNLNSVILNSQLFRFELKTISLHFALQSFTNGYCKLFRFQGQFEKAGYNCMIYAEACEIIIVPKVYAKLLTCSCRPCDWCLITREFPGPSL